MDALNSIFDADVAWPLVAAILLAGILLAAFMSTSVDKQLRRIGFAGAGLATVALLWAALATTLS